MSDQVVTKPGIFIDGTYVQRRDAKAGSNGKNYRDHLISIDPAYAPLRFSAEVGSEVDKALAALEVGKPVTVRVNPPYLAKSAAGNQYLAGFRIQEVL